MRRGNGSLGGIDTSFSSLIGGRKHRADALLVDRFRKNAMQMLVKLTVLVNKIGSLINASIIIIPLVR